MRRPLLALAAIAWLAAAALAAPATAVTLTFDLDALEGEYLALPDHASQAVVPSSSAIFRATSIVLYLEARSACAGASPCDPASSFRIEIDSGAFLSIGPFDDALDLELELWPWPFPRRRTFLAGESLELTLWLGRFSETSPLPVPSAGATVTHAAVVLTGDFFPVPEPSPLLLALAALAASVLARVRER